MSISYVLVLLGLGIFGCAVWALFWAIDDGQYDDIEKHGDVPLEENGGSPQFLGNGGCPQLLGNGDRPAGADTPAPERR